MRYKKPIFAILGLAGVFFLFQNATIVHHLITR